MASFTVLKSVVIILISFGAGFLYYYVVSHENKDVKRKKIDQATSFLINFIIFIWLGKVIAKWSLFIKEPFAVLAYPSNATSFYIATVLITINMLYISRRKNVQLHDYFYSFLSVFLVATFVYEILQWTLNGHQYNGILLLFITIVLIVFTIKQNINLNDLYIFLTIVLVGLLIISTSSSLMTLFGYILSPFYFISLLIFMFVIIYRHKRKV